MYLHRDIGDIENYWHFYLLKHRRLSMLARTTVFDPATLDVRSVPAGSFVLAPVEDARFAPAQSGVLKLLKTVHTEEDHDSLRVFQRVDESK